MNLAIIGTGYVGLVTGTCFAESGNTVTCVDNDGRKIERLNLGEIPIYEPGLAELVNRNARAGRLTFTTDLAAGVADAEVVYLAVGTPQGDDGSADLSMLRRVVDGLSESIRDDVILVTKSTVPVGTNAWIYQRLYERNKKRYHVASNPEFLKEGTAINDFMYPDRVVVGVRESAVGEVLRELYSPFLRTDKPFLVMSPESAELTKYVANALLATKISFINEMANLCERMHGDINDVRRGIGHDQRIGFAFLFPGVGYGGSCFPKDVRALACMARTAGLPPTILDAVDQVNEAQKIVLLEKITGHFGEHLGGLRFAVWGLAFKPKTDDIREAPSLVLIRKLLERGAAITVFDPEATENVRAEMGDAIEYAEQSMEALAGADALAINTEWDVFRHPDFRQMRSIMRTPVVFDGRNLYEPRVLRELGFTYYSIGRTAVVGEPCPPAAVTRRKGVGRGALPPRTSEAPSHGRKGTVPFFGLLPKNRDSPRRTPVARLSEPQISTRRVERRERRFAARDGPAFNRAAGPTRGSNPGRRRGRRRPAEEEFPGRRSCASRASSGASGARRRASSSVCRSIPALDSRSPPIERCSRSARRSARKPPGVRSPTAERS